MGRKRGSLEGVRERGFKYERKEKESGNSKSPA
jgi:hypothetical protein